MDEQVLKSLIKWPNVPACFGWLALDRRGQWRMRDEYAQQNQLSGQVIQHAALVDFISRNYARDLLGRYFFQNGPQRVFINLDATPWIARMIPNAQGIKMTNQCGTQVEPTGALSDENGNIYIIANAPEVIYEDSNQQQDQFHTQEQQTVALLHDHDLDLFADLAKLNEEACSFGGSWLWQGKRLPLEPIHSQELSKRFGFIQKPMPI